MIEDKKIFITGGTGFFGNSLQFHCDQMFNNEVVLLSKNGSRPQLLKSAFLSNNTVSFVEGDVRDFEIFETDFDYIIHAATTSCAVISDEEMESVVIDGTRHMLDFAAANTSLRKFLYVSSGAVYGTTYQSPVPETYPRDPVTVYGRSKMAAEEMCLESDLPCVIARCFAFVGEHLPLDIHFAIGNFIKNCLDGEDIVIQGDGTPVRTYLHAADFVQWVLAILVNGRVGEAYNLGSDESVTIAELGETVKRISRTNTEVKVLSPDSGAAPSYYVPDISKASLELGVKTTFNLEESVEAVLTYHRRLRDKPVPGPHSPDT
jgi:nucleoside-diphosphate-sugar epimerase